MKNKKVVILIGVILLLVTISSCSIDQNEEKPIINENLKENTSDNSKDVSSTNENDKYLNENNKYLVGYSGSGFEIDEKYEELAKLEIQSKIRLDSELKKIIRSEFSYDYNSRIIADMMSQRVIKAVQDIMSTSQEDFVEGLGKFNSENFKHGTFIVEELNDEKDNINYWFSLDDLDDLYKPIDYSSMVGLKNRFEKIVGMCSDFATFNASALRLWGKSPEDVTVLHIPGHAILSFEDNEEDYLFDNEYLLRREDNSNLYTSINKKILLFKYKQDFSILNHPYKKINSIYNDIYNYIPNIESDISDEVLKGVYDRLNIKYDENDLDYTDKNYLNKKVTLDKSYEDISSENMKKVYELALKENNPKYNNSKYRYRTLLVKNPEYYLRAQLYDLKGPSRIKSLMFRFFIRELESIDNAMQFIKNLNDNSIYLESHRVMDPEQIIIFNQADSKSKAMFLYLILEEFKRDSLIIYTDENSYIVVKDDDANKMYRLDTVELTDSIEGTPNLILNKEEVYYPLMNRFELSDDTKSILKQYNIDLTID